jgi:hypothetical protein
MIARVWMAAGSLLCAGVLTANTGPVSAALRAEGSWTAAATVNVPVPAQYAALDARIAAGLDAFSSTIARMAPLHGRRPPNSKNLGWAELLVANGNRQGALLEPTAMASVDVNLRALKRLGVGGVVLGIKLPLLIASYQPRAADYADFYATVARHARALGFGVDVELSAMFCGTIYAQCSYRYPDSVSAWAELTAEQARTVINRVHPGWLDLISEPNTEATLTGITALDTKSGLVSFVTAAVHNIGRQGSTKLVAGAASWYGPDWDQALAATPIDALVTHVYPATAGTAANLVRTAQIAKRAGKPLVADEMWLYKAVPTLSGGVGASSQEGALATYSFWEPLDVRFMRAVRQWATKAGVAFVSGFWSQLAFAYVTWTAAAGSRPAAQQVAASAQAAGQAMVAGTTTLTGRALIGR